MPQNIFWKIPPEIKIYEALWAIWDDRVKINENEWKVISSTWNKTYHVKYDPAKNAIISNDNASYYRWYLGYPAIAFLIEKWLLSYNENYSKALKWIKWKDLNVKYKYNYDKVIEEINKKLEKQWINLYQFNNFISKILEEIKRKKFKILYPKEKPPTGY